jgi:hypothetical protein
MSKLISLSHALTTSQLNALINSFPAHKDLEVHRGTYIVVVRMRGNEILSAAKSPTRALWHVMARPGLVTTDLGNNKEQA